MFDAISIDSNSGTYKVQFIERGFEMLDHLVEEAHHIILDSNLKELYASELKKIIEHPNVVILEATERNKELAQVIPVIQKLIGNSIRRDQTLIGIGGGIIQDITCFIASVLFRGIDWKLVPTTLLAQADSCIGSKSSINLQGTKNILGTFNPPSEIYILPGFLDTLERNEILSGIGEILKVHIIDGVESFEQISSSYEKLFDERQILMDFIRKSLMIKKRFIEVDEFDKGVRNLLNYGHSFGHAIESATDFSIPHGIAVTIGMDMANGIACSQGLLPVSHYENMKEILERNYAGFRSTKIPPLKFFEALRKDKKNIGDDIVIIVPTGETAEIKKVRLRADDTFVSQCGEFLSTFVL